MSFKLPHDLSEVKGQLTVSMLDDNYDAIQAWANDIEARHLGLFKQVDLLVKENEALKKLVHANQTHIPIKQALFAQTPLLSQLPTAAAKLKRRSGKR